MEQQIAEFLNRISESTRRGIAMFDGGNVGNAVLGFKVEQASKNIQCGLQDIARSIERLAINIENNKTPNK